MHLAFVAANEQVSKSIKLGLFFQWLEMVTLCTLKIPSRRSGSLDIFKVHGICSQEVWGMYLLSDMHVLHLTVNKSEHGE